MLHEGKTVHKQSTILKLYPQLDADGLIRVGGRLQQAQMPENSKHKIILAHGEDLVAKFSAYGHSREARTCWS